VKNQGEKIMNKKAFIVFLMFFVTLFLVGCQSREIVYNDNDDFFTDENIDWYSSDEWGGSIDGSRIRVGDFDINGDVVQLVASRAAPATFDQIFYNKDGYLADYRLSADLLINSMPEQEGIYNKFGFYAAYQNEQNFVWVFVHPLENEQFISVTTMVNGAWETVWKVYTIMEGIDKTAVNNLEVVKVGSDFRVYFNQILVAAFEADIAEAQFGLMSEEMTYTASNITFEPVTEFDKNTAGYGDSADEGLMASGDYDIVLDTVILNGDDTVSMIFKEDVLLDDFVIQANIDYTALNNNARVGYVTSYQNEDNYVLIYYTPTNNSVNVVSLIEGVESIEEFNIDHLEITHFKFQAYKIGDFGRVYIDDQLVGEYSVPDVETSFGLYSLSADVKYSSFNASEVTAFPVETWGGTFDGVIPQRGLYEVDGTDITILSTANGGYGSLETVFYRGEDPLVDFLVSTKMYVDSVEDFTSSNKWGYVFYYDANNYLEVFIIPQNNQIYTVGKVAGEFLWPGDGYWHSVYTFTEGTDFTNPIQLDVLKVEGVFTITVNTEDSFTLDLPAFTTFAMQVGFEGEQTAPIHFDDFTYTSVAAEDMGPVITDNVLETSFEAGSVAPDFTAYISATDNIDGVITITAAMVDITDVDMSSVGTFDVVYSVTDSDLNTTTYTITFIITAAPQEDWGDSYDGLIESNGLFEATATNVTITATNSGGYNDMERVFYNGSDNLVDFAVSANVSIGSEIVLTANNKYGFRLHNSLTDYIEIFVIPYLDGVYTVAKVDDVFVKLWIKEYSIDSSFDYTVATELKVEKIGADIIVFLNGVYIFTVTVPEFELMEMQVAVIGEITAPVYFEDFSYVSAVADTIAPTFDDIPEQTIEAGSSFDFLALIVNEVDNNPGTIIKAVEVDGIVYDTVGTYTVSVSVSDVYGNKTIKDIIVNVVDTTPPTFDLIADVEISIGQADIDFSTYITNEADNAIGLIVKAETEDNIVYDVEGTYTVTVSLTDVEGNVATQTFNVTVILDPSPILVDLQLETVFELGSAAPDFTTYITANDDVDGAITITTAMIDSTSVDMNIEGVYDVVFTVTDTDVNTSTLTITITVQDAWGDSYDDLIVSNNQYSVVGNDVTITNSLLGGYGSMEQVYYTLKTPTSDFTFNTDIRIDSSVVVDGNTKYGFILYNSPDNYVEIFIIPNLDGLYTVVKVGGLWDRLWVSEYSFGATLDFTEANNFKVEKIGADIKVYVNGVLAFTYTNVAFDGMIMQVGLVGEKTAPVYFENFSYLENGIWGDSFDSSIFSNDQYSVEGNDITITNSLLGAYNEMERFFYNSSEPLIDFVVKANISIDSSVVVNANTKYGFRLHNSLANYLEIFIIPNSQAIFTVLKVDNVFVKLWINEYTIDPSFDYTAATELRVEKSGADILVYFDNVYIFTVTVPAFESMELQAAVIAEKTSPVYFEDFSYAVE
jgi:hypothetical protein